MKEASEEGRESSTTQQRNNMSTNLVNQYVWKETIVSNSVLFCIGERLSRRPRADILPCVDENEMIYRSITKADAFDECAYNRIAWIDETLRSASVCSREHTVNRSVNTQLCRVHRGHSESRRNWSDRSFVAANGVLLLKGAPNEGGTVSYAIER